MAHQQVLNSDSFSLHEEGPDFSQGNVEIQEAMRREHRGSDSPDFGFSGSNISPDVGNKGHGSKKGNRTPKDTVEELRQELEKTRKELHKHQEEHKRQILHAETISMMTKYQLVFIKMESTLIKVAHIIKNRESINLTQGFFRILQHSKNNTTMRKYKTQLIYYNVKENTEKMTNALANLQKGSMLKGFKAIWFASRIWKTDKLFKDEKEKIIKTFNEALLSKDKEINQYTKKIDDLNNQSNASKSKESDYAAKIRQKEKHIAALELEKANILNSKKSISGDSTAISIKVLEERIRDLQNDNEDLKDKLSSAESNVGTFIREMSDLLDSHELSINIGSDENASFHNQEVDEDFDSSAKVKEKGGQQNRGGGGAKENQAKVLPQRAAYQSSQNRYPKIQHI